MSFKQAFSFSSDDFQAYLQERHIDLTCPVCHKDKFNLMAQNIVELDFEDSDSENQLSYLAFTPSFGMSSDSPLPVIQQEIQQLIHHAKEQGKSVPFLMEAIANNSMILDLISQSARVPVALVFCEHCGYVMPFFRSMLIQWVKEYKNVDKNSNNGDNNYEPN